jgi:septum formation protein
MLRMLSGREHTVYTGVTLLLQKGERETIKKSFHEATKVIFYQMTEEEIEAYVATKDPLDKAGAYGIQGLCARYIRGIEGDYNNVVGLPVGRLYQEIKGLLL